ncbi:hypothetical protein [Bacillus thuringiensis]
MASNGSIHKINVGDYVTSEMESFFQLRIDGRQVVRHEQYKPVPFKFCKKVAQ